MIVILIGWRLDRAGLFYFGTTPRGTPARQALSLGCSRRGS